VVSENPYEPSPSVFAGERNESDTLEPVELEPGAILRRARQLFARAPGTVLGAVFVPFLVGRVFSVAQEGVAHRRPVLEQTFPTMVVDGFEVALVFVDVAVGVLLSLGAARILSRLARGLPAHLLQLLGELANFVSGLVALVLFGLAVAAGTLLLVVPGIVAAIGLQFYSYTIVEQDLGPVAALRESWQLTRGHRLKIFTTYIVFASVPVLLVLVTWGAQPLATVVFHVFYVFMTVVQAVIYHSLLHARAESG
jgi:hypothetical protein